MSKIVVFLNLTLDGVMQGPGRPDEDPRDGFPYSGWAVPYADPTLGRSVGASMASSGALLLGRRTYEDFYSVWPNRKDNPFTEVLNNTPKYVASTTLKKPLPWMNSILLKGDVYRDVADLKSQVEKDIVILGSGVLVRSLMKENLIDRYMLLIHPLVLGEGKRLFDQGNPYNSLKLVDSETSGKGVIIATYEPVESAERVG